MLEDLIDKIHKEGAIPQFTEAFQYYSQAQLDILKNDDTFPLTSSIQRQIYTNALEHVISMSKGISNNDNKDSVVIASMILLNNVSTTILDITPTYLGMRSFVGRVNPRGINEDIIAFGGKMREKAQEVLAEANNEGRNLGQTFADNPAEFPNNLIGGELDNVLPKPEEGGMTIEERRKFVMLWNGAYCIDEIYKP